MAVKRVADGQVTGFTTADETDGADGDVFDFRRTKHANIFFSGDTGTVTVYAPAGIPGSDFPHDLGDLFDNVSVVWAPCNAFGTNGVWAITAGQFNPMPILSHSFPILRFKSDDNYQMTVAAK